MFLVLIIVIAIVSWGGPKQFKEEVQKVLAGWPEHWPNRKRDC